jgi:tetratricopeptide (TPR) repeat protein
MLDRKSGDPQILPLYKEGRITMKRLSCSFIWLFFISIFAVPSADAIVSATQSPKNPWEKKYSGKRAPLLIAADPSAQQDLYARAEALYREKKYDEVIITLAGPAYADPSNFKLNVLLAKAQLEKCAILKAKGDKSYKALVKDPYMTGRRLHKIDKTRPEPYYIVAKALLINNRRDRSIRTIKKALYYSPNNSEYFIVLGDAYREMGEFEKGRGDEERFFRLAKDAYEKALKFGKDIPGVSTTAEKKIDELSKKMKGEDTDTAGPQKETKIQRVKLRSTPRLTDDSDLKTMIRECNFFVKNRNDEGEFPNDFVDNGDGTITDRTTGLMWEKGGSSTAMRYRSAKRYVSRLNKERSGGYNDWRIPTTEELASLLERDRNNRALYIAPFFDGRQKAYWTSDTVPTAHTWAIRNNVIDFSNGSIESTISESGVPNTSGWEEDKCFIRAVRSKK